MEDLYSLAKDMLQQENYDGALKGFLKVAAIDVDYKDTKKHIAEIRKLLVAEKRENSPHRYTLGPEDVLEINVINHPEFSGTVSVEAGGEIILPLTKEVVMANGLTKEELAEALKQRLQKFVKTPEVSVVITQYNSKKWYILGEVGIRGEYPMGKTRLTLMEALYKARLPVENTAAMRRVVLIKPHKTRPKHRWIDVYALLYQGKMEHNVRIEPGDIIYVPKTVATKVGDLIEHITGPITETNTMAEAVQDLSTTLKAITPLKYTLTPRIKQ